jgi:hypothetical protein
MWDFHEIFMEKEASHQRVVLQLLPAIVSLLTQRAGENGFVLDVKQNIISFGPLVVLAHPVACLLSIASWRALRLGDWYACLWYAARGFFAGDAPPNILYRDSPKWQVAARWLFFGLLTLPNYAFLLTCRGIPLTQLWATIMITRFLIGETLTFFWDPDETEVVLTNKWPETPLYIRAPKQLAISNRQLVKDDNVSHEQIDFQRSSLPDPRDKSPCETIQLFNSFSKSSAKSGVRQAVNLSRRLYLEEGLFNANFGWTCRHPRCLIYRCISFVLCYTAVTCIVADLLLVVWLFQSALWPLSFRLASWALRTRSTELFITIIWYAISLLGLIILILLGVWFILKQLTKWLMSVHWLLCRITQLLLNISIPILGTRYLMRLRWFRAPTVGFVVWVVHVPMIAVICGLPLVLAVGIAKIYRNGNSDAQSLLQGGILNDEQEGEDYKDGKQAKEASDTGGRERRVQPLSEPATEEKRAGSQHQLLSDGATTESREDGELEEYFGEVLMMVRVVLFVIATLQRDTA